MTCWNVPKNSITYNNNNNNALFKPHSSGLTTFQIIHKVYIGY